MHLINTLASGVVGAENGTVTIYQRGTSSRAATYSDWNGTSANSRAADLQLDENGGLTVYTNQIVDCIVKDSDGATVRTFSAGDETTAITYSGTAFTGVDPVTGQTAINKPKVLKEILDLFLTSFGTTNGQVSFGGSSRNLYQVLAGLGYFYNVKDPLYGALGDGAADDTAGIQAALTACGNVGGGIVFFPEGEYWTTAVLNVPERVSLLGSGSNITYLSNRGDTDGNYDTLSFDDTGDSAIRAQTLVQGIQFVARSSHTGNIIQLGDEMSIVFRDCVIGGADTLEQGTLVIGNGSTTGYITFDNCSFGAEVTGQKCIGDLDAAVVTVSNCLFAITPTTYTGTLVSTGSGITNIRDCLFNATLVTTGTVTCIDAGAHGSGHCDVSGCRFLGGGGTVYAMTITAGTIREDGNTVSSASLYGTGISTASLMDQCDLGSRLNRQLDVSLPDTTAVTVSVLEYGNINVTTSGTGTQDRTIYLADAPAGSIATIFMINAGAGEHTFQIRGAGGLYQPALDSAVSVGSLVGFTMRSIYASGDAQWYCVGKVAEFP